MGDLFTYGQILFLSMGAGQWRRHTGAMENFPPPNSRKDQLSNSSKHSPSLRWLAPPLVRAMNRRIGSGHSSSFNTPYYSSPNEFNNRITNQDTLPPLTGA